jgi:exopolysaccharide biosynthesis WecB/TagA/CpsF family protein
VTLAQGDAGSAKALLLGRDHIPLVTKQLFGLDFADVDAIAAAAWLAARPLGAPFGYMVTPNADHFTRLHCDPVLAEIYRRALLRLLDSRVVGRFGRLLGLNMPRVAPGSDVTSRLLRQHIRRDEPITIVGMRTAHVARLARRHGLTSLTHYNPPMDFDQDPAALEAAVAFVLTNPSRFVFLAVGSPRQERLAAAIAASGEATGTGLCIGASLEFLAGVRRRAPSVMQLAGLEWLFRFLAQPRRLYRRYIIDSPLVFRLLLNERIRRSGAGQQPPTTQPP